MSDFQLGQLVTYSEHIRRRDSRPGEFLGPNRIWSNNGGPGLENTYAGGEGVIVGKRTLTEGNVSYVGEYAEYIPRRSFTAYLIAFDLRRKPVHVLPEHIEVIP